MSVSSHASASPLRLAVAMLVGCAMPVTHATEPATLPDAAEELDEVVVIAEGITVSALKDQKDIPKSVTIVSGEELEVFNATGITDVLQRLGNIRWNYGNPSTGGITVRGITTSASGSTVDPSLGVTVDGVPYGTVPLTAGVDHIDVASISVTRGPQGSQGGQNTTTGTVNIVNRAPEFTPGASALVTLGDRNAIIAQAVITGPVINDVLAYRVSVARNQQDGEYANALRDNKDRHSWGNIDRTFGRVQLLYTPTDTFKVLLSLNKKPKGIEYSNGLSFSLTQPATYVNGAPTYVPNGQPGATNTSRNKLERAYFTSVDPDAYQNSLRYPVYNLNDRGQQIGTSGGLIRVDWTLPAGTLTSITGRQRQFYQASNSSTAWDISQNGGFEIRYRQTSEELTFTSNEGGFLDYKAGLYYFRTRGQQDVRSRFGSDAGAFNANAAQYATLESNIGLLKNSLDRAYTEQFTYAKRRSSAAYANLNWHLAQPLTLTTGLRVTREKREASQNRLVTEYGYGAALNPAAYGGFASGTNGALTTNTPEQLAVADSVAARYFGAADYAALNAAQRQQVAAAKALRASQVFNQLFDTTAAEPYKGTLYSGILSLSYQLSNDLTSYAAWQRGVKAGISQISGVDRNGAPISRLVDPEESNSYELGLKGSYLRGQLVVNADVFYTRLRNFQQTVYILDPVLTEQAGTNTYTSISGNAPLVIAQGLEVDAAWTGIENLVLRLAAAVNDADYEKSILLAKPAERGNETPAFEDRKGSSVASVQKYTANLSGQYSLPVLENKRFHFDFNFHWGSSRNADAGQSIYSRIGGYGLLDVGLGYGRSDGLFDVNLIVKNALDKQFQETKSWTGYIPGNGRWYGVQFTGRLGF